jgi:hypothetical protein
MEIRSFEGPLAFDDEEQQAKLLQGLGPHLTKAAHDSTRLKYVLDEARQTVAEFVHDWLLQRDAWGEKKIEHIKVYFKGEPGLPAEPIMPADEMKP